MSYRVQHKFWLDIDREPEAAINDAVVHLKQTRNFASTIRDGIRLMCDLRAGRTDVLLELFPFVREALAGDDGKTAAIQRQLSELEKLLMGQDGGQVMAPVAIQTGPKPMQLPRPPADDDTPLVIMKSAATGDSAAAFLQSAFALQ